MRRENYTQHNYISRTTLYNSPNSLNEGEEIFDNLKWMTTSEAAHYLRKSVNALRTSVCRGHIHARKFKRRLYFKRSELDNLIETSNY